MTLRLALPVFASLLAGWGGALAESCRSPPGVKETPASRTRDCPPEERLQPYDPDRVKAGRSLGVIDLGNGAEVRIGGRVRMEYDTRR